MSKPAKWTMTKPAKWTVEQDFYGHTYSMGRDGESIARVAIKLDPSAPEMDRVRLILRTLNAGEVALGEAAPPAEPGEGGG